MSRKGINAAFLVLAAGSIAMLGSGRDAFGADFGSSGRKQSMSYVSYIISFPTAGTAEFLGNSVSFRGVGAEWLSPLGTSDLLLGVSLRWLYFRDIVDQGTFTQGSTTATGRLYRSIDSFPISLNVKYMFGEEGGKVVPFVGMGAGTTYGIRDLDIGALSQDNYGWQFLLAPEAGAIFKPSEQGTFRGVLSVRYDAGFGTDAIPAISNLSVALGIGSNF